MNAIVLAQLDVATLRSLAVAAILVGAFATANVLVAELIVRKPVLGRLLAKSLQGASGGKVSTNFIAFLSNK